MALADIFDALTTTRVYKQSWSVDEATQLIREQKGKHFDPEKGVADTMAASLGLYLAYGIIQKHRGTLGVESVLVTGTRFRITLPIAGVSNNNRIDKALRKLGQTAKLLRTSGWGQPRNGLR